MNRIIRIDRATFDAMTPAEQIDTLVMAVKSGAPNDTVEVSIQDFARVEPRAGDIVKVRIAE
jgi:hypothetical protein